MKIMLLFLLLLIIESCPAQNNFSLPQKTRQQPVQQTIFLEPLNNHQNFVITYLRSANRKKTSYNFFHHQTANNKTAVVACCKISKLPFSIDRTWLHYNFNSPITDQAVTKIINVAGELMDTFFNEYSIQGR